MCTICFFHSHAIKSVTISIWFLSTYTLLFMPQSASPKTPVADPQLARARMEEEVFMLAFAFLDFFAFFWFCFHEVSIFSFK